jgi:hypothetical protein
MRISARRASQFRYAFRAGRSDALHNALPRSLKTSQRWWIDSYRAGYDSGLRVWYRLMGIWVPPKHNHRWDRPC